MRRRQRGVQGGLALCLDHWDAPILTSSHTPRYIYAVNQCSTRFSSDPKEFHTLLAVKRIVRYLKGTWEKGLIVNPTGELGWIAPLMPTSVEIGGLRIPPIRQVSGAEINTCLLCQAACSIGHPRYRYSLPCPGLSMKAVASWTQCTICCPSERLLARSMSTWVCRKTTQFGWSQRYSRITKWVQYGCHLSQDHSKVEAYWNSIFLFKEQTWDGSIEILEVDTMEH